MSYGPGSPRQRHHDRGSTACHPRESRESRERESPGPPLWHQPHHGPEVAQPPDCSATRQTVSDARMGPKQPRSTVLLIEEEAIIVASGGTRFWPLDDCLYALQPTL